MTDKFNKLAGSDSLVQAVKDVLAGVPTETQEKVEALDPVNPKAVKKKFDDRKDKDIDNDGDTDASDKYLHKKRKAISKNVKKNGKGDAVDTEPKLDNGKSDIQDKVTKNVKEAKDINTKEVDKIIKHDCASHVKHAAFGEGQCISGQHTIVEDPDNPGTGHVTHYDVMFKNGPRYNVRVEELEIISESSHGHSRKKKTKEDVGSIGTDKNPANKQHMCAKNVVHEEWGDGKCIPEKHADPDDNGHVEWYDVLFDHGIESKVPVSEMKVTKESSHIHSSKKPNEKKKVKSEKVDEVKSAPKGYHFTKDGKLKKGDADADGDGGEKLRSDPLDKQRKKIPPLPEKKTVKEGTWHMPSPSDIRKLKALVKKPIKLGKEGSNAVEIIGDFIGDDELSDNLYMAGKRKPNGDARDVLKKWIKQRIKDNDYGLGRKTAQMAAQIGMAEELELPEPVEKRLKKIVKNLKKSVKGHDKQQDYLDKLVKKDAQNERTLTPAEKKKREEVAKAIEKDKPGMPMDQKMAIATSVAKKHTNELTQAESMTIRSNFTAHYRDKVSKILKDTILDIEEARRGRPKKGGEEGEGGLEHIQTQLRKVINLRGKKPVEFANGKVVNNITPSQAQKVLQKIDRIRIANDKLDAVRYIRQSPQNFKKYHDNKEGEINPQKIKQMRLRGRI